MIMGTLNGNLWLFALIAFLTCLSACQAEKDSLSKSKPGIFELRRGKLQIRFTNWGATMLSVKVPDAKGKVADVVLGFDTLTPYMNGTSPYFGAIVGRVANRIKDGEFILDGKTYHLPKNDGNNTLHGGKKGFDKVLWRVRRLKKGPRPSIQFTYHSRDGEQGFPGVLDVSATYTLSGPRELTLEIKAVPRTKATPVSLAQHTYWNLAGEASNRSILSNKVTIWAHSITPVDKHLIPTGAIVPVKGTPYDFTKPTAVGKRIKDVPGGYDINYVLDLPKSKHRLRRAVRVKDDFSGRILDLWTNNIGLQFYSSNQIKKIVGKEGAIYRKYAGLALETQAFPDAVDQSKFPSIIYRPGQIYRHVMVYKFSVEK